MAGRRKKALEADDERVDVILMMLIYKNCDKLGRLPVRQIQFLWEKKTGCQWDYKKMTIPRYLQKSSAFAFHKGRRAGQHQVSLSPDALTMSKLHHLICEDQTKYRNLLFSFIKKGDLRVVKNLLEDKGVDDNLEDKNGDKPIHYAVRYSKLDILKYFIDDRCISIDEKNKFQESPVFFAAKTADHTCLEYLVVEKSANTTLRDQIGLRPAFFPIKEGRIAHVRILISPDNVNEYLCADDYTPLQLAVHWSQDNIVDWLLTQENLDLFKANKNGKLPIDFAKTDGIRQKLDTLMRRRGWGGPGTVMRGAAEDEPVAMGVVAPVLSLPSASSASSAVFVGDEGAEEGGETDDASSDDGGLEIEKPKPKPKPVVVGSASSSSSSSSSDDEGEGEGQEKDGEFEFAAAIPFVPGKLGDDKQGDGDGIRGEPMEW